MATDTDRLQTIQEEFNSVLETRIGDLMGAVRATQEVTRQLITAEQEIRRQDALRERLEAELEPLKSKGDELEAENRELQGRVDKLRDNVDRMRSLRDELMSNLSNLKGELDDE
jgi:chromosome segregation ATPase